MSVTDFHNHVIPGVDDGARDAGQARAAVEAFRAAGVAVVIATPHVNGSVTHDPAALARRLSELDVGWSQLEKACEGCGVELRRGAEVALDIPRPDLSDPRLRLAGSEYVLVEFAYMTVPQGSQRLLAEVAAGGWTPVLAHPERYGGVEALVDAARGWRQAGAYLQVNGGSLLGKYGPEPRRRALRLLDAGLVDFICSDFHAQGKPRIPEYRALLVQLGGPELAELLLDVNPQRILQETKPLPVPPLQSGRSSVWDRMLRLFR